MFQRETVRLGRGTIHDVVGEWLWSLLAGDDDYVDDAGEWRLPDRRPYQRSWWDPEDGLLLPAEYPPAPTPTDALPGSEAKVEVMRRRFAQGVSLHHPRDAKSDHPRLGMLPFRRPNGQDGPSPGHAYHSHRGPEAGAWGPGDLGPPAPGAADD